MRTFLVAAAAALIAHAGFPGEITRASVIATMNQHRARGGLAPLREEARLDAAAADRMREMEEQGYWAHEGPAGRSPFFWLQARGYDFRHAGENLASGFETVELLVQSWMESPGHRENIMSTNFRDCGVAEIDGSTTGPSSGKSVVVLFGRRKLPEEAQAIRR